MLKKIRGQGKKEFIMSDLNYPNDRMYMDEHTWIKEAEDGTAYIGISDFAQDQLGEVAFIDFPEIDDTFDTGDIFGSIESIKAVSDLYLPLGGTVVEVNDDLEDDPELVNKSPYDDGWIIRIEIDEEADRSNLMDADDYASDL